MVYASFSSRTSQKITVRIYILTGLVFFAFIILFFHLWRLQISQHKKYLDLSEHNRIRLVRLRSNRGLILDRNHSILADERPCYKAILVPEDLGEPSPTLDLLGRIVDLSPEAIQEKIQQQSLPFKPITVKKNLSFKEVSLLEEYKMDLPGISVEVDPVRHYPNGSLAVHALGHMGQVTMTQLRRQKKRRLKPGDFTGQSGVEKVQNLFLTGIDGGKQVEVDAQGRELEIMGIVKPQPGNNIILTLDLALQKRAEELLEGKTGCILAADPQTGEILCLANSPSYNPNKFVSGITPGDWKEMTTNPQSPLHNRAIQAQYPSGSVIKLILASTALELGIIDKNTVINCGGSIRRNKWVYSCWKKKWGGHGKVNLYRAIVESCNIFFYEIGIRIGIDQIAHFADFFGLGKKNGIDLENEKPGLLPTPAWKLRRFGIPWLPGDTIAVSIGQGYLSVTPLQMLSLISSFANGGIRYRPRIISKWETPEGRVLKKSQPQIIKHLPISPQNIEMVKTGLWGVVNNRRGTGTAARIKGFGVSGKTGTAQVVRKKDSDDDLKEEDIPVKFRDHAWFIAFAPYDQPQIAVVVLVEHGGHGGSSSAPLAREIIKTYLKNKNITEPSSPNRPFFPEAEKKSSPPKDSSPEV